MLSDSDVVFVLAAVTSENRGLPRRARASPPMRPGAAFILLSRADVVDFDALMAAVASGHIRAASDVFPEEPMPADPPGARRSTGFLRSAHRAGALDGAFMRMGDMVLEDMALIDRGLPPLRCKRAERETVARMRSKPGVGQLMGHAVVTGGTRGIGAAVALRLARDGWTVTAASNAPDEADADLRAVADVRTARRDRRWLGRGPLRRPPVARRAGELRRDASRGARNTTWRSSPA